MEPQIQTKDFDDFYLITGKALFIASDFENDLNALSKFLKIKSDPNILSSPKLVELFFEKYQPASKRIKSIGLESDLFNLFDKAVQSRNHIAHMLALSIFNYQQADIESIDRFIEIEVKPHVESILTASSILKSFFAKMNNEDRPLNWVQKQSDWVCSYEK